MISLEEYIAAAEKVVDQFPIEVTDNLKGPFGPFFQIVTGTITGPGVKELMSSRILVGYTLGKYFNERGFGETDDFLFAKNTTGKEDMNRYFPTIEEWEQAVRAIIGMCFDI